jgi:hypothetical protein
MISVFSSGKIFAIFQQRNWNFLTCENSTNFANFLLFSPNFQYQNFKKTNDHDSGSEITSFQSQNLLFRPSLQLAWSGLNTICRLHVSWQQRKKLNSSYLPFKGEGMPTIGASVITTVGEGMFLLHSSTGDFWIDNFPFISQSSHT